MAQFSEGRIDNFSINELQGTRCRLQRLSDLKFFAGWIKSTHSQHMTVELKDKEPVSERDQFNVEASNGVANVALPCMLARVESDVLCLVVTGEPRFTTPGQEARYRVDHLSVFLYGADISQEAEPSDISDNGLGVWTSEPLPRFAKVRLTVRGPSMVVECTGTVRYCRSDPQRMGDHRIGLELDFDDRLSRAMWQRIVRSAATNPQKAA